MLQTVRYLRSMALDLAVIIIIISCSTSRGLTISHGPR
jgi:hypothetical protein